MVSFPKEFDYDKTFFSTYEVLQPQSEDWFGLFPVRSPLLRELIVFFLFLRLLRCFSSPGCSC